MNISQLYQDFHIQTAPEDHQHNRSGWVNVECPHCTGNPGYHLGYNLTGNYFYCFRCESHGFYYTLSKLLHLREDEVREITKQYGGVLQQVKEPVVKIRLKAHRLPSNTAPMTWQHKLYLSSRGFDPDQLEREWMLLGTGPVSLLDGVDYKLRVIAPIFWGNTQVSFQGRDITKRARLKYRICPKDRELVFHKHILYGKQECWGDTGICVEGITDVWRLGVKAFATFGIEYTRKQVSVIAKTFRRVVVIFDGEEPQALRQANKLVAELKFRNVKAWREDIVGDPGDMKQEEANYLVKQIIK